MSLLERIIEESEGRIVLIEVGPFPEKEEDAEIEKLGAIGEPLPSE